MSSDEIDWAATYRASAYGYVDLAGEWTWFTLDGGAPSSLPCPTSVTLLTAWNPQSREMPRGWNDAANARLAQNLAAAGVRFTAAVGCSLPGVLPAWREEGFALHGVSVAEAIGWGRLCAQRALVRLESHSAVLMFCVDGQMMPCGLHRLDPPPCG